MLIIIRVTHHACDDWWVAMTSDSHQYEAELWFVASRVLRKHSFPHNEALLLTPTHMKMFSLLYVQMLHAVLVSIFHRRSTLLINILGRLKECLYS